jgi:hypothetical protein
MKTLLSINSDVALTTISKYFTILSYHSQAKLVEVNHPEKFVTTTLGSISHLPGMETVKLARDLRPLLLCYNVDQYTIEYYKVPYSLLALSLEGMWVNVDEVTQSQLDYIESLSPEQVVKSSEIELSEYSKLVTFGWVQ